MPVCGLAYFLSLNFSLLSLGWLDAPKATGSQENGSFEASFAFLLGLEEEEGDGGGDGAGGGDDDDGDRGGDGMAVSIGGVRVVLSAEDRDAVASNVECLM